MPETIRSCARWGWIVLALAVTLGLAAIVYRAKHPAAPEVAQPPPQEKPAPDEGPGRLTPAEGLELTRRARRAVGLLENELVVQAEVLFQEIAVQTSGEAFARRNLAICRLLMLQKNLPEDMSPADRGAAAIRAVQELLRVEPKAADAHWLAGAVYAALAEAAADETQRIQHTLEALRLQEEAMRLDPASPVWCVAYYHAGRFQSDPQVVAKAQGALRRAYDLAPTNLYILTEWLHVQAELRDAGVAESLGRVAEVLRPLAAAIRRRTNVDPLALVAQAGAAAAAANWPAVRRAVLPLKNLVRSEDASQSDMRRVDVNPLEFLAYDFSPEFRARLAMPPPPPAGGEPIVLRAVEWKDPDSTSGTIRDAQLVDFDLDGRQDLAVLRDSRLDIYRRTSPGLDGELVASASIPPDLDHLLIADLDHDSVAASGGTPPAGAAGTPAEGEPCYDADGDFVIYGRGGWLVLRNRRSDAGPARTLELVDQGEALPKSVSVHAALLADLDHDGDLDILASTAEGVRFWSNRGQLLFEDQTSFSEVPPATVRLESLAMVDWDRDVDLDVLAAGEGGGAAGYFENLRHGQFRWRTLDPAFGQAASATRLRPVEADGNPSWDMISSGPGGMHVSLTRTVPAQAVTPVRQDLIDAAEATGLQCADFDNDGWQDLLAWTSDWVRLWRGSGAGGFAPVLDAFPGVTGGLDQAVAQDATEDGKCDVLAVRDGKVLLLVNESTGTNGFLALQCKGGQDNRSGRVNAWGIGSLVEVKAEGMYQAQVVTGPVTHFGLNRLERADLARILWTQGIPQSVMEPSANSLVCEPMTLKGSCPYVYLWNGQRFEFFTDLLWGAPLGLQLADGVVARDRPWEYLKVPGHLLAARGDAYVLQITEELWEAAYFDHVELLAVDHPADVEIFSNEKVGPASMAEFKVHTVRQRRPLTAARNQHGRDLLPQLRQADGVMAQAFDATLRQGLAEEHFLELELGSPDAARPAMLYLTGWIRPTDTSLNVGLSHHPQLSPPRPPRLWVPAGNGTWREALPFMGFPGGKTKTIAIDLTGIFPATDYRLRIVTSAEIYWDEAFFAAAEPPAELRITPLKLRSADLHYRGFSAAIAGDRSRPETYDYGRVRETPQWPPMRGRFTRYGDVRELLEQIDARLAVLAAGDEITVAFDTPPGDLPAGWKRDFILHSVGWDKDADLHTIAGQTVEPLPYVGMESYPPDTSPHADRLPDAGHHLRPGDAVWADYLRRYQTRETSRTRFWRLGEP